MPRLDTSLPVFVQISEALMREILAGRLMVGDKLPTEREMAKTYGVAVGTLRKALNLLEEKGVLERVQGSGNYIRSRDGIDSVYELFRLEKIGGGGLPTAQLLSLDRLEKPGDLPRFGTSAEATRFRRVRRLDDAVAALEEIWLDGDVAADIRADQVSESLYKFYKDRLGILISGAEDRLSVAPVPGWSAPAFAPAPGTPVTFVERDTRDQHGHQIEYSRTWVDPGVARYVARIK